MKSRPRPDGRRRATRQRTPGAAPATDRRCVGPYAPPARRSRHL